MKKKMLPLKTMIKYEKWIKDVEGNVISSFDDYEKLPDELKLRVEYVNDNDMPEDTEALLCPASDDEKSQFNGIIRIKNMYKGTKFAYMHEIIHYLLDVGVGKPVTEVFARKVKGKTIDEHEQDVNYITAAATMKKEDIEAVINDYDRNKPHVDELVFVNTLCAKYNQSNEAVIRRIQEVRRLLKA